MDKRPLKVFLCHASADKPKVRELYRTLKRRGVQPWLDAEDLIPGQNWEVEIPKALLSSDAIIICLTPNSVDKEGYVQKEIKFALDKAMEMPDGRIFIIPARLEECELPFSLKKYHAVELYEKTGYTKLMQSLKLRASQLERATVQLPKAGETTSEIKKVVEEKKPPEPKDEKSETKTPKPAVDKIGVGGDVKESVIVSGSGNVINFGEQRKSEPEKQPKKTKSSRKPNTAIIVALIGLVGTIVAALVSSPILTSLFQQTPEPTATLAFTPTKTETPAPSKTPTKTFTPIATPFATEITDSKGIIMRLVPAGEFTMGSENGSDDEKPVHQVYLDAFYMDIYEVTNAAYKACVTAGGCTSPQNTIRYNDRAKENHPVVYVYFIQAIDYCEWRGAGLPTEAQWEKAARGDDGRTYPWGEGIDSDHANYSSNVGDTTEVGSYESGKSPYGMYDMAGNVWEWVADWYGEYTNSPSYNPLGPSSGSYRVLRGGSWLKDDNDVRSAKRYAGASYLLNYYFFGFRCARSIDETITINETAMPITPPTIPVAYTLQSEEFPNCIARRLNLDPTDLLQASGLEVSDVYYVGLVLTIPQNSTWPVQELGSRSFREHPTTYTVTGSSDTTVYGVACKFGDVFPEDIAALNDIVMDAALSQGQVLQIP